ncbi:MULTISPECIES: molybdenum cofactor guanylyltransferase [unclassified Meiothermus]|uniref:molybdenum cofactor guanylyltransferase n=1 Tax=unclassified Meiothermus TaxID=370471 RepID=UPI000D7BA52F|nr:MULTISPECIES: molybdenum cofactor guanylyltransferase [unclassified Meiothermus]PZA07306.1 molybdenum cofactor guanylyltransferase [Meiothermus sp. Pnk-1]RYM29200.1 molybdenum cofactor guanylyltransferase [Meiothermus sp. PNK-Is4]
MTYSGAVLAGGKSRRFGQDKARFLWRGKALLEWSLEALSGASERFVVANQPYPEFAVRVYADRIPGGDSLSGLHSALSYAQNDWVAVAACDLPFLTPEYWDFLGGRAGAYQAVAGVGPQGFPEPLAALYHRALLPEVEARLIRRELKLQAVLRSARTLYIPWSELELRFGPHLYTNLNTPGDLGR